MSANSFDSATATFEQDVLEASKEVPVVVDFWAPWCAPCRVLKPVLEKLVAEYGGKFRLAKVNTDENQEIAGRYGVRGIPNVKAFVDGRVAAEFTGALPESAVREFLDELIPSPSEKVRRAARTDLWQGDFEAAEKKLHEALALDDANHAARIDLAELLVARQDFPAAETLLAAVPEPARDDRAAQLATRVAAWKRGLALPDLAALKARVEADPADLEARLALADRLVADGQLDGALEALLEVVRRGRGETRERARKAMVDAFALSDDAELVGRFRRALASALY